MIVYADILIVINLIVDYFLLLATAKILHIKTKLWRMIISALEGALFSLYIFLPQSKAYTELLIRATVCFLMAFTAFGFINLKDYLKSSGVYFFISCLYAGIMTALWRILKPQGMVINNSVVYFDISAVALIISTVFFYLAFVLLSRIFSSSHKYAEKCLIIARYSTKEIEFEAIVDTGNSLTDNFGNSGIIIVTKPLAERLFGVTDLNLNPEIKNRYRAIPCSTISGSDILNGFRCDSATILLSDKKFQLKNPVLAVSKVSAGGDYGIVNPQIFENVGVEYESKNEKAYK